MLSLNRIIRCCLVCVSLVMSGLGSTALAAPAASNNSLTAPILLVTNDVAPNKFGAFLGEILRAEGLNAFDQVDLNSLTDTQLAQYDLAILAETPLSGSQSNLLTSYVQNGGALLAMRPDGQIASLFGLDTNAGTLSDGYLQISNTAVFNGPAPGLGLTPVTLQIHGQADQYTITGTAVSIAKLYSDAATGTDYPAVVAANSGSGQAVAFTYDLASNVAYTRQGNPANADLDVDNDYVVRTVDLFQTVGNPTASWINRDKIPVPQADVQQRLFARLVQQLIGRHRPMPQFWYFPETAKTMLILTSDAHWNSMSDYNNLIGDTNAHQGHITVYLSDRLTMPGTEGNITDWPTEADLLDWQAQGDMAGIHPWRLDGTTLTDGFDNVDSWFAITYTLATRSNTIRIHQLAWEGWTAAADIEAAHNLGIDFSYYHWGPWLQKPDSTWPHGYITGSGLPMKFVRADGTLTSVYQQLTEMADDQLFAGLAGLEGLTGAQAVALSQSLIDASLAGNYSALTDIHHVDNYSTNPELAIWLTGDIDYARSQGVPVWNADRWLAFTQTRHDANFSNITWDSGAGKLSFDLAMMATADISPTTILPAEYSGKPLNSVTLDSGTYTFTLQTINSANVAFVTIPAGNHNVTATYQDPTAVSLRTFGANSTGTIWTPIGLGVVTLLAVFAWRMRRFRIN